ncbi:MAG TPA: DUF1871 family protein [Cerasibacillus sp.]|uniref:DUF1871 family protein n=1 Tax=Cerasibacillus sp. TaxID=2498711 RepID=UPI002F41AF09
MINKIATDIVKRHINRWDPFDLLYLGAPDDEYETEVEMIVKELSKIQNENDLAEVIQDTFNKMFGTEQFTNETCQPIALLIWQEILKAKK